MGDLSLQQRKALNGFSCLANFAVFAMAVTIVILVQMADDLSAIDFTSIELIPTDWDELPYIDIITSTTPCTSGYEDVSTDMWGGMVTGCYVTEYGYSPWIMTYSDYNT